MLVFKRLFKLKISDWLLIAFSVTMFFDGYCYFTWPTLKNSVVNVLSSYTRVITAILLLAYSIYKKVSKNNRSKLLITKKQFMWEISALILIVFLMAYGYISIGGMVVFIVAIAFTLLNQEDKQRLFKYALIFFCLIVLPSLIYFILDLIGINLPHSVLYSNQQRKFDIGWNYSRYFLGLISREKNFGLVDRMSGIFDESGYVGTLAALFIAGGYKRVNNKWLIILFIEGLFSFSMAFYLMLVLFIIVRAYLDGAAKVAAVLLTISFLFYIFMNVSFELPALQRIQSRIDFTSFFLVGNNRETNSSKAVFDDFFHSSRLLIGYGHNAAASNPNIYGSFSYKMFIYDYGIVGLIFHAIYYAWNIIVNKYNKNMLPFIFVFIACFYQRPYVFTEVYITIFMGAIAMQSTEDNGRKILREKHLNQGLLVRFMR